MKRGSFYLVVAAALLLSALPAHRSAGAQEVGGGISFFLPISAFEQSEGSLSVETALETALQVGPILSLPLGVTYNQVWGLTPRGNDRSGDPLDVSAPWFYADALSPYIAIQLRLPAGAFFLDLYGGGIMNFNLTLRPLVGAMVEDLEDLRRGNGGDGERIAGLESLSVESGVGYGFMVGTGVGMRFSGLRLILSATYRHLIHPLTLSGRYYDVSGSVESFDADRSSDPLYVENLELLLRGSRSVLTPRFKYELLSTTVVTNPT